MYSVLGVAASCWVAFLTRETYEYSWIQDPDTTLRKSYYNIVRGHQTPKWRKMLLIFLSMSEGNNQRWGTSGSYLPDLGEALDGVPLLSSLADFLRASSRPPLRENCAEVAASPKWTLCSSKLIPTFRTVSSRGFGGGGAVRSNILPASLYRFEWASPNLFSQQGRGWCKNSRVNDTGRVYEIEKSAWTGQCTEVNPRGHRSPKSVWWAN